MAEGVAKPVQRALRQARAMAKGLDDPTVPLRMVEAMARDVVRELERAVMELKHEQRGGA